MMHTTAVAEQKEQKEYKRIVITHGDIDGVISAAVLCINYDIPVNVIFTQPFLINRVNIPEDVEEIYVSDIAVNNRDPNMTIEFINKYKDKIVVWYDHHMGGEVLVQHLDDKAVVDTSMPSCPALMQEAGLEVPEYWVEVANAADRPVEYKTELREYEVFNNALKAVINIEELSDKREYVMRTIVEYLVKEYRGENNEKEKSVLEEYGLKYQEVVANTLSKAEEVEVRQIGKYRVGVVKIEKELSVDITRLCMEVYDRGVDIVVIQGYNRITGEPSNIVATKLKINLVDIFSLKSGAPFRVTLTGPHEEKLSEILSILENKLQ